MSINCILITFCFPFSALFWVSLVWFGFNPPTTGKGSGGTMDADCCSYKDSNGFPPNHVTWPKCQIPFLLREGLYDAREPPAGNYSPSQLEDLNIKLSFVLSLIDLCALSSKTVVRITPSFWKEFVLNDNTVTGLFLKDIRYRWTPMWNRCVGQGLGKACRASMTSLGTPACSPP